MVLDHPAHLLQLMQRRDEVLVMMIRSRPDRAAFRFVQLW